MKLIKKIWNKINSFLITHSLKNVIWIIIGLLLNSIIIIAELIALIQGETSYKHWYPWAILSADLFLLILMIWKIYKLTHLTRKTKQMSFIRITKIKKKS